MDSRVHFHLSFMKNYFLVLFIFIFSLTAWACPGCAGGINKGGTQWTLIILGTFIVACYVPFYILFRAAKTYDPKNNLVDGNE